MSRFWPLVFVLFFGAGPESCPTTCYEEATPSPTPDFSPTPKPGTTCTRPEYDPATECAWITCTVAGGESYDELYCCDDPADGPPCGTIEQ